MTPRYRIHEIHNSTHDEVELELNEYAAAGARLHTATRLGYASGPKTGDGRTHRYDWLVVLDTHDGGPE